MRAVTLLSSVVAIAGVNAQSSAADGPVTGTKGNATVFTNNPPNVEFEAVIPTDAFTKSAFPNGGNVKGFIRARSHESGIGVDFEVEFTNLPKTVQGPFGYHIHAAAVPDNGNCTATLAHLDPTVRGEDPVCDSKLPQTCQVGDLAGKYGKITSDPFIAKFTDPFASTNPANSGFFGNLSFVIHMPNKTRITCANFKLAKGSATIAAPSASASSDLSSTNTTTPTAAGTGSPVGPSGGSSSPTFATVSAAAGLLQSTAWAVGAAGLFTAITFML